MNHYTLTLDRGPIQTTGPDWDVSDYQRKVWTVEMVRAELPPIDLIVNGTRCAATISGRCNRFATVRTRDDGRGYECTASWATIANCLTRGVPLRY